MKFLSLVICGLLGCSAVSQAQDLEFNNLSEKDLETIIEEYSANFSHSSVSGAGTLGRIFGFEVGLVGGMTKTPKVDALVKEQDPSIDADKAPHATLLGVLTVPYGLSTEIGFVPKIGDDDFSYSRVGLALKWTATETLLSDLPLSLALKAHYAKTDIKYQQPVNGQPTDVSFDNTVWGLTAMASKSFVLVEPYIGLGYLMADGDIHVSGSSTIFNFTTSTSASKKKSDLQLLAGAELKLLLVKLGIEYSRQFETDRYLAKLAFYF